jgi:inorganic pyrophosphatase
LNITKIWKKANGVKINGWEGPEAATKEIVDGMANYQKSLQA